MDMLKNYFKKLVATDRAKTLKFAKLCHSLYSSTFCDMKMHSSVIHSLTAGSRVKVGCIIGLQ